MVLVLRASKQFSKARKCERNTFGFFLVCHTFFWPTKIMLNDFFFNFANKSFLVIIFDKVVLSL